MPATRIEDETKDVFADRHIGPREAELAQMLAASASAPWPS